MYILPIHRLNVTNQLYGVNKPAQSKIISPQVIFTAVWLTHPKQLISHLAWGIVTWKINYVPSTWGRQEGGVHFHIRNRQPVTDAHTLVTFKQVYVSHSGLGGSRPAGQGACWGGWPSGWRQEAGWWETTPQVSDRLKMNRNAGWLVVCFYCMLVWHKGGCWLPIPVQNIAKPKKVLKRLTLQLL